MNQMFSVYIPLAISITAMLGFLIINFRNSSKMIDKMESVTDKDETSQVKYSRLIYLFEFISKFPPTQKGANQLYDLVSGLGVYNIVQQRVETARMLLTSYVLLLLSFIAVYFMTDSLILRVGAVIIAMIFRRDYINKKMRKLQIQVWEDVYRSMASLKNEWERTRALEKSFNKAIVELKARRLFASVQNLFKSSSPDADLAIFNQNNSNRIFQRFADLCYNSFYHGVSEPANSKVDTFISNLDIIMRDLQVEIDLAKSEKKKFYIPEKLPLVGLAVVAFAPGFLTNRYPGLYYFYHSSTGYLLSAIATLSVIIAYFFVSNINDSDKPIDDTFDFEVRLFLKPKFKSFWENRLPKNTRYIEGHLNRALSYLSPAQLQFRKVYMSLAVGLLVFIITAGYVVVQKGTIATDLTKLPADTIEAVKLKYGDEEEFAERYTFDYNLNDNYTMTEALRDEGLSLSDTALAATAQVFLENRIRYQNASYKVWYLFIVLGGLIIGKMIPGMLLNRRISMVDVEVKNEILMLYAVVVQMMYTPLKLRDYLKRFVYLSRLYPKTHLDCYIRQFNSPEFIKDKAKLMHDTNYFDFMEKLYSLRSDKHPQEVFREIQNKRDYLYNQVLEARKLRLENNYRILSAVSIATLIVTITLQLMIPLAIFSFSAMKQYGGF